MKATPSFVRTTLGASLLLAAGVAQADFTSNYNGALTNSGGGTTYVFAGADYQDPITPPTLPTIGLVNEGVGDDAAIIQGLIPAGNVYTYYGITVELTPGQAGTLDLTQNSQLSFRIKANTATAHNQFVVRVEDSNGGAEFNNTAYTIPNLTTTYQDITIPLTFFQGGGQPATLTIAKNITFGAVGLPGPGNNIEVDFTVDDIVVDGPALPPDPNSGPVTSFKIDFNDQPLTTPLGGVINAEWGYGNPFFGGDAPDSYIEIAPGDYARDLTGTLVNGGDSFSYVVHFMRMNANPAVGRDFSQATHVKFDFRKNAGDNLLWRVRLEDTFTPDYLTDQADIPSPTTSFTTYTIPISEFQDGNYGTPVNMTALRTLTFLSEPGPLGVTPSIEPSMTIDNIEFIFPIANGDADGDGDLNAADVTAIYNNISLSIPLSGDGDIDNDTDVDAADANALINHLVNGTPLP